MTRFNPNRVRQQVGGTLRPRSRRSGSGQVHALWQGVGVPNAPTNLAVQSRGTTSITISFTAPSDDGNSAITNYRYSINNGSSWTAFSPVDTTSPVTISGLTVQTSYNIKLRAVNDAGEGEASATLVASTLDNFTVQFLVVAGGGGGGNSNGTYPGGGGGGGGYRTSVTGETSGRGSAAQSPLALGVGTYTVTVGGGGAVQTSGNNSAFHTVSCTGGGRGGYGGNDTVYSGGCGGGRAANPNGTFPKAGAAGTAGEGYDGSPAPNSAGGNEMGGGGGAGGAGGFQGGGGSGLASTITGSSVSRANGGGVLAPSSTGGANTGAGGGASGYTGSGAAGGSGVVVVRYNDSLRASYGYTISGGSVTTSGVWRIHTFTGSGSLVIS